jgi:apolipoprotein N-acyltransferase
MKRNIILVFISASMLVASFAPFNITLTAWFGLVPLFLAMEGKGKRDLCSITILWGLLFFIGTVYWVVHSMYYYGGVPAYIGILVLFLLVFYMSLYTVLFGLGFYTTRKLGVTLSIITISSLWVGLEYLRGFLLTGFPWVLLGYSQSTFLPIIQFADITGVWGVSFLIVAFNYIFFIFLKAVINRQKLPLKECISVLLIIVSALIYGYLRIGQINSITNSWKEVKVGIAQGNIDQSVKWDPAFQMETIDIYRELSIDISRNGARLIVWPETAIPFFLQSNDRLGPIVYETARETGSYIIAGSPSFDKSDGKVEYYNSAFLISPEGKITGRYDKIHLVPFGEYVPLKRILFFINKLTEGVGDFSSGKELEPLVFNQTNTTGKPPSFNYSVGIMICFESIFPELARGLIKNGANLLAVITNDAWFGRTSAPYQHFEMAIFRAVENRSFLLRAANTGISGVIDPTGRIAIKGELFTKERIVGKVRLREGPLTIYTRYGDFFAITCLVFSLLIIFIYSFKKSHGSD